jgi:hypothetical protein
MRDIADDLAKVLAEMTGAAEVDGLDANSNEWRSHIVSANAVLARYGNRVRINTSKRVRYEGPHYPQPVEGTIKEVRFEGVREIVVLRMDRFSDVILDGSGILAALKEVDPEVTHRSEFDVMKEVGGKGGAS